MIDGLQNADDLPSRGSRDARLLCQGACERPWGEACLPASAAFDPMTSDDRRAALVAGQELADFAGLVIHSRQNVSPRRLHAPGPAAQQLQEILATAGAAPDHRQLLPWRFVIVPAAQRSRLADAFALALLERDPSATPVQVESARDKAHRAPFLMLAIARLSEGDGQASTPSDRASHSEVTQAEFVNDAERLVSLGCAIQNIILSAHAAGFGTGLTSGQALASPRIRALFSLGDKEQAVCCINIGTVTQHKPAKLRPAVSDYVSELS